MKRIIHITILILLFYLSPLVLADTTEATKTLPPAASLEVIKSLSEAVKSLSETVKILSESATKTDRTAAKDSITTPATKANQGLSFRGEFDSHLMPLLLEVNLPKLKRNNPLYQVDVQDLAFHLNTDTNNQLGLALNNIFFKVGHFNLDLKWFAVKATLENLEVQIKGDLQKEAVNYVWQTNLEKLLLPATRQEDKGLNLSYVSKIELRQIDATAMLELQTALNGLSKQFQEGVWSETELDAAVEQKVKELLPRLLAKSPEMTLSELTLTSPNGQLQGEATIQIDGTKPLSLANEEELQNSLVGALTVQANFSISKHLLAEGLMLGGDNAETVEEKIQALLDDKILVVAGEEETENEEHEEKAKDENVTYRSVIKLEEGKLTINGEVEDLRLNLMKDKVAEAVQLLVALQKPAENYWTQHGSSPKVEAIQGNTSSRYVASIVSEPEEFYFEATLKGVSEGVEREIAGKTVRMVFDKENKSWQCESGDSDGVENQYLPEDCRAEE